MDAYYYGCYSHVGHRMHDRDSYPDWDFLKNNPWGIGVDGDLCPDNKQIQGQACVHHKDGWTALAFWDRSIDSNPGSISVFILSGTHDFSIMVEKFKRLYPAIVGRFTFPITLYKEKS